MIMKFVIVASSRYHVFLVVVLMLLLAAVSILNQNVDVVLSVTALTTTTTTTSSTSTSTSTATPSIIPEDHKLFETYNKFQSWKNSNKNTNILQEFQVQEEHLVISTTISNDNDDDNQNQNQKSQSRNLRISHFASSNVCFGISDSLQTPNAANLACRAERLKINNEVVTGARRVKVGDVITYMNDKSDRRTNVPSDNSERAKRFCASRLRVVKTLSDTGSSHTPLRVLYEDNCMAIVCKPAGIHSMSYSGTFGKSLCLDEILPLLLQPPTEDNFDDNDEYGDESLLAPLPCHRLDRRVAGPVVVAKTRRALVALTRCFEEKTVTKEYRALVSGEINTNNTNTIANTNTDNVITDQSNNSTKLSSSSSSFTITSDIDGRESETEVVVLDKTPCNMNGILTDLQLFPKTGRTHQLRIHCANVLQTPIIGDDLYWNYEGNEGDDDSIPNPVPIRKRHGLYLYCKKVSIPHPLHVGKIVSGEIPEPFRITRTREKSLKGYEWSKAATAAAAAEKRTTKENESESAQEYFRRVMYAR